MFKNAPKGAGFQKEFYEKMTLMLWYGGSLADELSVQELGEKLYSLVTLV